MNYFEVLYTNCFGNKYVALIATNETEPTKTKYSFATGFNGCKIADYKSTDYDHYRKNKIQFFKNYTFSA